MKLMAFFGVSQPAFYLGYPKFGEFQVQKQSQGRMNDNIITKCLKSTIKRWQKRWMVVDRSNIWYYSSFDDDIYNISDCVSLDIDSDVHIEEITSKKVVLRIQTNRRILRLKVKNLYNGLYCLYCLISLFESSEYCRAQYHESFAPKRLNNAFEYFIDGKGYFERVFETLEKATDEILICGWMISPEMPLIRSAHALIKETDTKKIMDYSRLDKTLDRAAKRGCSVYILVYREFNVSMYNNSEHAKLSLEKMDKRIKVMRHPNKVFFFWSHHEKLVIVDRTVCFIGGLDLTWGRWDTPCHALLQGEENCLEGKGEQNFPGLDYYNPLVKDMIDVRKYTESLIEPSNPRMPWHDVAVMLNGGVVGDFTHHFRNYWNNSRESADEKEVLFAMPINKNAKGVPAPRSNQIEDVPIEVREVIASLKIDLEGFLDKLKRGKDKTEEDIRQMAPWNVRVFGN